MRDFPVFFLRVVVSDDNGQATEPQTAG